MDSPLTSKVGDFASKFTTPTFQLVVSTCLPPKTFNVHKVVLETGCPYFETLFSTRLPTQEVAENKIILDSTVDCEDAWSMVIEYLYLGDYGITGRRLVSPNGKWKAGKLKRNAHVYVLALKLCMEELKMLAIKKTEALLAGFYDCDWYLTPFGLKQVVEIVYPNTPDADEGKGQCADEHEQVSCDPMRALIAKYAASLLTNYRGFKDFMDLVQNWSEFSRDLLLYTEDGARVSNTVLA